MEKHICIGKKGETVVYTISNLQCVNNTISWDAFNFFTPVGTQVVDGFNCFVVQADQILLARDNDLDKEFYIKVAQGVETAFYQVLDGAECPALNTNKEGDIIIWGKIPSDPGSEIEVNYKEVIDE